MTGAQRIRVTVMTHRGAVRESNENATVVGGFVASEVDLADPVTWQLETDEPVVVAVADGLGGWTRTAGLATQRMGYLTMPVRPSRQRTS